MGKKETTGKALQDIGICILLVALLLCAILLSATPDLYVEGLIMLAGIFLAVLFASFRLTPVAIVIAGLQVVAFIAYKIYMSVAMGDYIEPLSFGWVALEAMAVCGAVMYVSGLKKMQLENQILKQQVEELIMIDPLTGFYNLRSMFMDIQTQISYAERNGKAISLMIIKLRYIKELKSVLKKTQYDDVRVRLAKLVVDTVRLEDRVYVIDEEGSLGVLLTCDRSGAKLVEGRLRKKLDDPASFDGIAQTPLRVEVKIGSLQYKKEEFQRDAILLKERVEEEVEYDICDIS
ncbi:MAG: GGDEF domain-containing protein [Lachnospiraceae bacterium]|nr:GGDEF domain-containing protein [Lachnospiraceae bacterium]